MIAKSFYRMLEDKKRRLEICASCEHKTEKVVLGIEYDACNVCGCVLTAKAQVPLSTCPLRKWTS